MTAKRFAYYEHKGADYILDTPNKSLDFIEMLGDCLEAEEIVDLLNCLNDENEQLKKQKVKYKRLSEIRDEEINNRIFTIKEFMDNCSNEKVKKALEDLFYSEVNEYDLSKKYRKLCEENEDLKEDNAILKESYKEILRKLDETIFDKAFLQKEKEGLYEENKQLKMHMNSVKAYLEGGHTKKAIERLKIIDIR